MICTFFVIFILGVLDRRWSASSFGSLILSGVLWVGACLCIHYGISTTILSEFGKLCLQLSSPLWDLVKLFGEVITERFVDLYEQWNRTKRGEDKKENNRGDEEENRVVDPELKPLLSKKNSK